jgi:hypothetical protein
MTQTTVTGILDYMATVETAELTSVGLTHAYGSTLPDNLGANDIVTVRWLNRQAYYDESEGATRAVYMGSQRRTLHVNIFLILGTGDPPSIMYPRAHLWLDRLANTYMKSAYVTREGYWQKIKIMEARYIERQLGGQAWYGLDHDAAIYVNDINNP